MRHDCDDEAFAGDFIEFSDSWSRAQVRSAWKIWAEIEEEQGEARLLETLRPKIIALHLTCVDAEPITDPAQLTPARTEQMDTRLYSWFALVWMRHLRELADLGNALGRTLLAISGMEVTTTETTMDAQPSLNHS
jgi:hypothetical protein